MPKPHLSDEDYAEMTPNIMPAKVREQMRRGKHKSGRPMKMKAQQPKPRTKSPMKRFK